MLSYFPFFCNAFSVYPTPARPGPAARWPQDRWCLLLVAVAWRAWGVAGLARLRRFQPCVQHTHAIRPALQLYVTCPSSPGQCSTARLWWIPHLVNLLENQTCQRRQAVQAHALVPAYLHTPSALHIIVREPRDTMQASWQTYGSKRCVPMGEGART
jgi:hypothetical protein